MTRKLDKLLKICTVSGIHIERAKLPANLKAILYSDNDTDPIITLNESIATCDDAACTLAEELGHYYTSHGNLLIGNLHKSIINKQETIAKRWAFTLSDLIDAHKACCATLHEVAEHLEITEEFLRDAAKVYASMYGTYIVHQGYRVYFEPLWVEKLI